MSAASSASSTAPPALHGAATAGPSPASGREPYRIKASAAGVLSRRPEALTGQDRRQELAPSNGIGNTPTMTASPPPTLYHRWMGWHAPALRRVAILAGIELAVTLALLPILPWQPAV